MCNQWLTEILKIVAATILLILFLQWGIKSIIKAANKIEASPEVSKLIVRITLYIIVIVLILMNGAYILGCVFPKNDTCSMALHDVGFPYLIELTAAIFILIVFERIASDYIEGQDKRAQKSLAEAISNYHDVNRISSFLNWYYREDLRELGPQGELCKFNDIEYPIIAFESWQEKQNSIGKLIKIHKIDFLTSHSLGEADLIKHEENTKTAESRSDYFHNYDEKYFRLIKKANKNIFNGRTYTLDKFSGWEEKSHEIKIIPGYYFDAIKTCDVLENELLKNISTGALNNIFYSLSNYPRLEFLREFSYRSVKPRLILRNNDRGKSEQNVPYLTSGKKRSAAFGISTLIVYNDGGAFRPLIGVRSTETAVHSGLAHVVPSMMYKPTFGDTIRGSSIATNIVAEYVREVLGKETFKNEKEFEEILKKDKAIFLPIGPSKKRKDGNYDFKKADGSLRNQLYYTGFALNLLNLRPEICTLLVIKDPAWIREVSDFNWEFGQKRDSLNNYIDLSLDKIDIQASEQEIEAYINSLHTKDFYFVPPGFAAFKLGMQLAKEILP